MKKIIALILALSIFTISSGCGKSYEEMVEEAARLTPEEQSILEDTKRVKKDNEEWKERKDEALNNVDLEFNHYQDLWNELKGIADNNGYIKATDMERAKTIADELNNALDLDITISDGYIENYDELCDSMK